MSLTRKLRFFTQIGILATFAACAHAYHYAPEISGEGATWSAGGVRFAVPSKDPKLNLLVMARSLISAPRSSRLPAGTEMIHIRMKLRASTGGHVKAVATIFPNQQVLTTDTGLSLEPALVRATSKDRPMIKITSSQKQIVELFFALPPKVRARDIQYFLFHWKVQLPDGRLAQQSVRFDRHDSSPQQSGGFGDYDLGPDLDQAIIPPGGVGGFGYW